MRKTFIALLAGLLLAACAEKAPERGALILGEATGFDPQDTVYAFLTRFYGGIGKIVETDTVRDGRFSYRLDSLDDAADHYLIIFESYKHGHIYGARTLGYGPELYLEPGTVVRVQGEGRYYRNARVHSPVKDQKLRQHFVKQLSLDDMKTHQEVSTHRQRLLEIARDEADWSQEKEDTLLARAKRDLEIMDAIRDKIWRQELKLLETEEIGAYALNRMRHLAGAVANGKKEYRESVTRLYERLSDEQKASADGMAILNYLNPAKTVGLGDPVPDYEYVDKDGKSVRISDFRGKWVLMDFWSRGCHNCHAAIPELGELSREFQDKLAVVSISVDKEPVWRKASEEHDITWNNWNDPKGAAGSVRAYGTDGLPTFVLVSPDGKIDYIMAGYGKGKLRDLIIVK